MRVSKRLPALLLLLVTMIGGAAGCARHSSDPPSSPSSPSSPAGDVTVVVHRTGGIAGMDDTVTVKPDGSWTATSRRGASTRMGQLTDAQRDQLRTLAADPRLGQEAGSTPGKTKCADAFNYTVTVGAHLVAYTDCPTDQTPPAASAVAKLVMQLIQP